MFRVVVCKSQVRPSVTVEITGGAAACAEGWDLIASLNRETIRCSPIDVGVPVVLVTEPIARLVLVVCENQIRVVVAV